MEVMELRRPGPAASRPLQRATRPEPVPDAGEVVVELEACAVCRTDLQIVEGDLASSLPLVPGHQVVGRVRVAGPGVPDGLVGARVGVTWLASSCGTCRFCASGRENLCTAARFTGWDRDGGFATAVVADHRFVHVLDERLDPVATAPLLCGGVIGYRSLRVAGVVPGDRLGLYGFGASASLVIQVARHWGCEVAVATRNPAEQARARALGAVWAGGYDETPPFPLDRAITFAPAGAVVVRALQALDRGGVVAVNAIHLDEIPRLDYADLWWERSVRSVANVTRDDAREFLAIAASIGLRTDARPVPLGAVGDALIALRDGTATGTAVLVPA
jgi:propanol-preferring alcohol dehydrogenase